MSKPDSKKDAKKLKEVSKPDSKKDSNLRKKHKKTKKNSIIQESVTQSDTSGEIVESKSVKFTTSTIGLVEHSGKLSSKSTDNLTTVTNLESTPTDEIDNIEDIATYQVEDIAADQVEYIAADQVEDIVTDQVEYIAADQVENIVTEQVEDIAADQVEDNLIDHTTEVVNNIRMLPTKSGHYELTIPLFQLKKEAVPISSIPQELPAVEVEVELETKEKEKTTPRNRFKKRISWINGKKKVSKSNKPIE